MAEVDTAKTPTLAEQYLLKEKEEKLDNSTKPEEEPEMKTPASATSEEVITPKTEETPVEIVSPAAAEESSGAPSVVTGESNEATPDAEESVGEATEAAAEESSGNAEPEDLGDQEVEETPEIKLETAPADFRFPTTNQSRHCFTRYIEYHRCVAAKGEGASECDKFAKYYRALCPGEWVDRWNEQRENGTFPGPL
ncbi:Cytochrome c oxidase subunit 6b-1 like [Actinidia chinensis var. chinensis]|uniref:Cytochrome c oxidase subunit 6b-1 like n=1 Tax=Actinidia chinensis var. chinensis TaxID=1590841 RepID=A0A2R6R2V0_ACTCC|nr:Cytochrome c oxidase subunit 6b-1 like [Actinidia chinensis var. chinensis]